MTEGKKRNNRWIWLAVLLLFISVAATTICVLDRFEGFIMNDDDAISLTPESENQENKETKAKYETTYNRPIKVGFETSSNSEVWESKTDIELFHVTYRDGEYNVTVESEGEDKIIAPGTEHSFVFKLKNTGEIAMDYDVEVDAYCEPLDTVIPIKGRITRYDGEIIAGENLEYVNITDHKKMKDSATLGAGKYLYYTLDWLWPFKQGTDELDTMLGNQTIKEEITFTVCVKTVSTISRNPDQSIGIHAPSTGDNQPIILWAALGIFAICMLVILLYYRKKDQESIEDAKRKEKKKKK